MSPYPKNIHNGAIFVGVAHNKQEEAALRAIMFAFWEIISQ